MMVEYTYRIQFPGKLCSPLTPDLPQDNFSNLMFSNFYFFPDRKGPANNMIDHRCSFNLQENIPFFIKLTIPSKRARSWEVSGTIISILSLAGISILFVWPLAISFSWVPLRKKTMNGNSLTVAPKGLGFSILRMTSKSTDERWRDRIFTPLIVTTGSYRACMLDRFTHRAYKYFSIGLIPLPEVPTHLCQLLG